MFRNRLETFVPAAQSAASQIGEYQVPCEVKATRKVGATDKMPVEAAA